MDLPMDVLKFRPQNERFLIGALETLELAAWEVSSATKDMVTPYAEEPTPEQCRNVMLGLIAEVTELLNEMDWKPWKVADKVDVYNLKDEAADVLVFIGMMLTILSGYGVEPRHVALAYLNKMDLVKRRLAGEVEGYVPRT